MLGLLQAVDQNYALLFEGDPLSDKAKRKDNGHREKERRRKNYIKNKG